MIPITKTYQRRTAGGWLKAAHIAESISGLTEIWLDNRRIAYPSLCGNYMLIADYGTCVARLLMSKRAEAKFWGLIHERGR